ncbi:MULTISPECIES: DNA polymerase I [unclassified Gemella]|uniref:DNA polymerase I n=1 Tax=unclassified Gemella TaxID=2624949 RepID=UPI0015D0843E|nr:MULTISPECIES: DNA polymerase I [unclassified Gemella]MBF0709879.1 DNA polymerase I [Gemella sp. GL1.1]NYS27223.1 DNA polymerase I [Gemella sp. GL1]
MKKILLLDGNSLIYRAFYAMPALKNKKGLYTNAVYGFSLMLDKLLEDVKPDQVLVAFDRGKATFRHQAYEGYKGTRDKTPSELVEQFSYVRELLDSYGVIYEDSDEYEADDIIGTYSLLAEENGYEVIVVSGDKDLTQLASDKVTVYYTKRGVTDIDYYTPTFIDEKYGIKPLQIIDMKGLMGDKSDNIPGIAGIGEKTALKLLKEYSSLEEVLNNIDNISGAKLKERLTNGREDALLSKKLATIYRQVPVEKSLGELTFKEDIDKKIALYEKLEFSSFLKKLQAETKDKEQVAVEVILADKSTELKLDKAAIHLEAYTDDYHKSDVLAVAVFEDNKSYIFSEDDFFAHKDMLEYLTSDKEKIIYDYKKILYRAKLRGIDINTKVFDPRIANYLADVTVADKLDKMAMYHLGENLANEEEIYGKGAKRKVPDKDVLNIYLAQVVKIVFQLRDVLYTSLEEQNMLSLYEEIELPTARVLADMEFTGINVSNLVLEEISNDLDDRTKILEQEIYDYAEKEFNIASPKQLGTVLFEDMGLPVIKKTKTGYSTAAEILEILQDKHPIIPLIMDYRLITKLNSTYAKGLVKDISSQGKIHTRYEQTLAQTGRLSSINPNLQNIPVRMEEGKKIRYAFIPSSKDHKILSIDYSQIELRVLAHIADDPVMIEAFNKDQDIHTRTASQVNGVPLSDVTDSMRREAKAVNFGIVYGISDFGLATNLGITRKRAKEFIEKYLETFYGVKNYMDSIVDFAKEHEYVETLFSRRRRLPDINSKNKMIVSLNSRIAMNSPIQGTAADIIKIAMIRVYEYLEKSNIRAKLLLQVHDELIFDVHKDDREKLEKVVRELMESAAELKVKLVADSSYGDNWYEAK